METSLYVLVIDMSFSTEVKMLRATVKYKLKSSNFFVQKPSDLPSKFNNQVTDDI